jgi:uncharacterized membrane protein (UPF0127 family)
MQARLSCRCRGVRLTSVLWLATSLPLHPTTSLLDDAHLPAALAYLELSKDSFGQKVIELQIPNRTGFVKLRAELADTESKKERGLMFRQSLPENSGMLFIFDPPTQAAFWMKNTRIPLSIAFVDNQGRILETRSMKPFDETPIWASLTPSPMHWRSTRVGSIVMEFERAPGSLVYPPYPGSTSVVRTARICIVGYRRETKCAAGVFWTK